MNMEAFTLAGSYVVESPSPASFFTFRHACMRQGDQSPLSTRKDHDLHAARSPRLTITLQKAN